MSLFRSMQLIKRSIPGYREKGEWKTGVPIDVSFRGTAQPATGRVLELLPAGKRNTETILVFAPMKMEGFTTADSETQVSGDIIIWEGRHYEVQTCKKWKAGLLPHWELLATRKKEGER